MRSKHFRLLCAVTILLMAIMACNLGSPAGSPTATLKPSATTLENIPTDAEPSTETATPEPTEESATETPTLTLEPSLTPTVALPVEKVIKEATCRKGPSGAYDLVLTFKVGDLVNVMARDLGAGFVFVQNPNEPDLGCWVLQSNLTIISGDLTPLPAFTPPSSPTLAPDFTIKYKNLDICKGNAYLRFIVTNTGSVGFRSAYVKVTNLKNKESTEQVVNIFSFDMTPGCNLPDDIAPLGIGQTAYLQSAVFQKGTPKGQKVQAVFQLCTEQNLKGACVTQSLQFVAK